MELTGTHLRYLLGMYTLSRSSSDIRLTEIANMLHVKKASVARIVTIFQQKEWVTQQPYGKVHLTAQGRAAAEQYDSCVARIADCLINSALQLTQEEAYAAACILLPALPERCQSFDSFSEIF